MKSKLKILAVFIVMFFASFIPESNHELFGDWKCKGNVIKTDDTGSRIMGCKYSGWHEHNPDWHWGTRHWLWLIAGLTFSAWTVIEVIKKENK